MTVYYCILCCFCGLLSFTKLPVELLEMLLMKAFNKCFSDCYKSKYVVHEAVSTAYVALAAVCSTWKQTISGWPQSSTRHWFRNKLKRQIRALCGRYFPTRIRGSNYAPFWTDSGIFGLTECDNKLYVVCQRSRKITVFQLDSRTDQRSAVMTTIDVLEMNQPTDIVACPETGQLYIAAWTADSRCVFRVSVDGDRIVKLKPSMKSETGDAATESIPYTLSIRSRRLVATSRDTDELLVYEADDLEPSKCIDLANGCYEMDGKTKKRHYPIRYPLHALETLSNTFVVSSRDRKPLITEIDSEGNVLRGYSEQGGGGHDPLQHLGWPWYLFGDSAGGFFVVDYDKHRVALLDGALSLQRFLVDVGHSWLTEGPRRMCYVEKTGRVFVASWNSVQEFRVHEPRSTQTA